MRAVTEGALWLVAAAASGCLVARALLPLAPPAPPAPPPALPRTLPPDQRAAVVAAAEELSRIARRPPSAPTGDQLEALSPTPLLDNPAVEGVGSVADWCGDGTAPTADWLYCPSNRTVVPGGLDYQPSPAANE